MYGTCFRCDGKKMSDFLVSVQSMDVTQSESAFRFSRRRVIGAR